MLSELFSDKCNCKKSTFEVEDVLRCYFCGGVNCKRCGPTAYTAQESPAFEKLHSSWITDSILAMQRPNENMLVQGKLLEQFRRYRISSIFNLTEAGEHPHCGCGNLETSGFPYNPETVMAAGIKHFNYSWRDMKVPPVSLMMDIVHVAYNEISNGSKIAVHCHAGFGRTGMVIACILIAGDNFTSDEAIEVVRQRRPGSIQTTPQENLIREFEIYFMDLMQVFPPHHFSPRKSIAKSIRDQFHGLSHDELSNHSLKVVSKVVLYINKEITAFVQKVDQSRTETVVVIATGFIGIKNKEPHQEGAAGITSAIKATTEPPAEHDSQVTGAEAIISADLAKSKSNLYSSSFSALPVKIKPEFFRKIFDEMNQNNWASMFELVGVLQRDDAAPIQVLDMFTTPVGTDIECIVYAGSALGYVLLEWIETRDDAFIEDSLIEKLEYHWYATEDVVIQGNNSVENLSQPPLHPFHLKNRALSIKSNISSTIGDNVSVAQTDDCDRGHLESPRIGQPLQDIREIGYLHLKKTLESSSNKVKLAHLDILVNIIRLVFVDGSKVRGTYKPLGFITSDGDIKTTPKGAIREENEEDLPQSLNITDLLIVRFAIAVTQADRKYPVLLSSRYLSLDFVEYLEKHVERSGTPDIWLMRPNAPKFSNVPEVAIKNICIVWNSFECLVKQNWTFSSHQTVSTRFNLQALVNASNQPPRQLQGSSNEGNNSSNMP